MAKQQILLVDADSSSARVLEVSLRSAGFTVTTADSAENALEKLEHGAPDLILTDTRLPGADGFAFVRGLRTRTELKDTPIVFLTEQGALEDKLRGLELGVDDYLAKPIFVREVVTRVHMLLARKNQQRIATESQVRTRFSGSLEDVAVVDLLQTIAISGKSGVALVRRGDREARLYFKNGQLVDAEVGDLRGEEAVYRTITWTTGTFDLEFRAVDRASVIEATTNALLMEGMRRVDELGRLAEQLPPESTVVDVDHDALLARLNEIPDELNGVLRLIDGKRTLLDLIDGSPFDDLSTLTVLSKFYFEGLLVAVEAPAARDEAPTSTPEPVSARTAVALPTAGMVLEASTPPTQAAVAAARADTKPAPPMPSSQVPAASAPRVVPSAPVSGPSTERTPEPPQPVRVVIPRDSDVPARDNVPLAARAPATAAHTAVTAPPPAPSVEHSQRPSAPVVRVALPPPVADQPKVTPKVILNVGDDSAPSSRSSASRVIPMPVSGRAVSRSDMKAIEPARHANGHANGASERAAMAEIAASAAVASSSTKRAEPISAAPFPLSAREAAPAAPAAPPEPQRAPAPAPPVAARRATTEPPPAPVLERAVEPASPVSPPVREQLDADRRQLVPAGIAGLSDSTLRFHDDTASEAVRATHEHAAPNGAGTSLAAGLRDGEGEPREAAPPGEPAEREPLRSEPPSWRGAEAEPAAQLEPHDVPEDEFFDAGDEGTYAGGPRSSIPAADTDSDPHPAQIYRSSPAHRARVRRSTALAMGIVLVGALSLLAVVWQNVGSSQDADAELAQDEPALVPSQEGAREGWPTAVRPPAGEAAIEQPESAASLQPSEEGAELAEAASAEPPAAVERAGVEPAPSGEASPEPATAPAPEPVAAAVPVAKPPAAPVQARAPEAKRAIAAAPKRPKAAPEAPKPAAVSPEPERASAVPRRAPADKPPTASFPPP